MPHCDEDWVEAHICAHRIPGMPNFSGRYGPAATDVHVGESGWFWIENGEYASTAAFCPFCGMAAPAIAGKDE